MDFEYLLFLQNLRAEAPNFINSLLLFISEFAAGSLPVVIIVVFYWCIDKRTGQRMGLCFAGATMVTQLIKNIACVYRPWKQDARLQIAPEAAATATGYSFPSGHATLAASFYGNIAAYLKKYSKWWILPCVLLTLLTAFARNWLGAHTLQDVLVGMMIALVVLGGRRQEPRLAAGDYRHHPVCRDADVHQREAVSDGCAAGRNAAG